MLIQNKVVVSRQCQHLDNLVLVHLSFIVVLRTVNYDLAKSSEVEYAGKRTFLTTSFGRLSKLFINHKHYIGMFRTNLHNSARQQGESNVVCIPVSPKYIDSGQHGLIMDRMGS